MESLMHHNDQISIHYVLNHTAVCSKNQNKPLTLRDRSDHHQCHLRCPRHPLPQTS